MSMENKIYYVATGYEFSNPVIVEKFDNDTDANSYAALMSRTKQRKHIVLEQITEWDGTALKSEK